MKDKDYGECLRQNGLKNTKRRAAILDILEKSSQPICAERVYKGLKELDVDADLSTVYRNLDAMTEKGIVTKINIAGDSSALFELNRMTHSHHLICMGCKKILTIDCCPLNSYERSLEKETNFSISGHKLNLFGYCPECREKGVQEYMK